MKDLKQAAKKPRVSRGNLRFKSHHERAPGAWILCDELSLFGRKIANKPTLSQLDGETDQ